MKRLFITLLSITIVFSAARATGCNWKNNINWGFFTLVPNCSSSYKYITGNIALNAAAPQNTTFSWTVDTVLSFA